MSLGRQLPLDSERKTEKSEALQQYTLLFANYSSSVLIRASETFVAPRDRDSAGDARWLISQGSGQSSRQARGAHAKR